MVSLWKELSGMRWRYFILFCANFYSGNRKVIHSALIYPDMTIDQCSLSMICTKKSMICNKQPPDNDLPRWRTSSPRVARVNSMWPFPHCFWLLIASHTITHLIYQPKMPNINCDMFLLNLNKGLLVITAQWHHIQIKGIPISLPWSSRRVKPNVLRRFETIIMMMIASDY